MNSSFVRRHPVKRRKRITILGIILLMVLGDAQMRKGNEVPRKASHRIREPLPGCLDRHEIEHMALHQ
jgi:hypothetical protein